MTCLESVSQQVHVLRICPQLPGAGIQALRDDSHRGPGFSSWFYRGRFLIWQHYWDTGGWAWLQEYITGGRFPLDHILYGLSFRSASCLPGGVRGGAASSHVLCCDVLPPHRPADHEERPLGPLTTTNSSSFSCFCQIFCTATEGQSGKLKNIHLLSHGIPETLKLYSSDQHETWTEKNMFKTKSQNLCLIQSMEKHHLWD